MRSKPNFALFLLIIFLLSACAPAQPSQAALVAAQVATQSAQSQVSTMVAQTLAPTITPSPTATMTPTPTATFAPASVSGQPDNGVLEARPHYTLDVDFSFNDRSAKVNETVAYTNRSGDALTDLYLMVELKSFKDLINITGLWWEDDTPIENSSWENVQVKLPLREALMPGQTIRFKIAYDFHLPGQSTLTGERPLPIGYTSRQANLVDWYPFIPPYRSGQGWLAHPPSYYGEHLVYDLSDFDVNLRLTDGPKDLVVAASAPAKQDGEWRRYQRTNTRSFALSIGSEYATQTEKVGGITITSYYFPLNVEAGKRALQTTVESIKLYQQLFGPYPHDSLAVVEADFFDGMEYDGLYFLSRAFYNTYKGGSDNYLVAIAAHETAHQWFYGIIGSDQANEPWLDEAMATYTERLYYEKYDPAALAWWWAYRVNYDHPTGWVDSSVYNPKGSLQTYQDYRDAVYLNGANFLEALRKAMGDPDFFAFLKDYTTQYAGQIALGRDFFALLAQHTKVDLTPVISKYFERPPLQ